MHKLLSILSLVLLYITIAFGQAVDIPITVSDNVGNTQILNFGLDPTATDGIDPALGESDLPPPPPGNAFDARWWLPPFAGTLSSWKDYRNAPAFPFTGSVEYQIKFQTTDFPVTISWALPPEIASTSLIQDLFGGVLVQEVFAGTGSLVITNTAITQLQVLVDYDGIGPAGPEFTITPAILDFGPVAVGNSSLLQATVENTGAADLDITNVVSLDPQYTVTPTAALIPPGGTALFDVTFTPASLGTQNADIEFTHNAPGSPTLYPVTGVGADAGPTFGVSPSSLDFGNVGVGTPETLTLTVSNDGLTNDLIINGATTTNPDFVVAPNPPSSFPIVIPALGTYDFDVTFTPSAPGITTGDVEFTHNAPTSPDLVPVQGNGVAEIGLIFQQDTVYQLEENFYTETMQLKATTAKIQSIQFRLKTNLNVDDNTILTFQNISKGTDVSDPSWVLDYNVFRGDIQSNGASQDVIYVLLYNLNQDGGLDPGNYNDLLNVTYRVADLPALTDSVKSSFLITNAEASTFEGFPVDITPSRDELVVIAKNRTGGYGDVNGDGCLDILDLIMVVDHIVGRDSLTAEEFERADIAPWTPGNMDPDPDGFVNVQDLSLIQNIILTGVFPNGVPVGPCGPPVIPKFNGEADAVVNIYINTEGISAYLDSKVGIRGAQIEFGSLSGDPGNLVINTPLGQGYYEQVDNQFRTLLYDRLGQKFIEEGNNQFMADMPFVITNPEDITLDKLILVDVDQQKVMKLEINIFYGTPQLPYDYILFQNYPNPFNPSTSVKFQVPQTGLVTIKIYDMLGQEVRTLFAGEVLRGTYTVEWDGLNDEGFKMSSGTYIYRMIAGDFMQSKKMVLLK